MKECSLYQFKTKNGSVINTTPKDITARKLASRASGYVNHGATTTVTIDLSVWRTLVTGHGNREQLRGMWIIRPGACVAVIPAAEITVSISGSTLTISNTTTTQSNASYVVS